MKTVERIGKRIEPALVPGIITLLLLLGLLFAVTACGTTKSGDPIQKQPDGTVAVNPGYSGPLEAVAEVGGPIYGQVATGILAILAGYAAHRNQKLKKTATVLTQNIAGLKPDTPSVAVMKLAQEKAGVKKEVESLLLRR